MITILEYADSITSVCSYWRGRGTLVELSRTSDINLIQADWKNDWTTIRGCDIAFFQRPMSKNCFQQVAMCKDLGLKIWIDLDDSNSVPPHHEVYKLWCEEYDEKIFTKIMMLADVVTVSTKYLKDFYLSYNNNVHIIPNAINDHWLPFNRFSNNKIILWRGGDHHLPDIFEYRKEIIEVMQNHKDWKIYCIGSPVQFFFGNIDNYEFKGDFSIHDYFAFIIQARPSIFLVPLIDNELNRAKSNISWQEATLSGGVALVPNYWNLYRNAMVYEDRKSFKYQFNKLIEDEDLRMELHKNSYDKIQKEYLLSNVNKQRLEIIKNLIK